jgi:hypothetical protein
MPQAHADPEEIKKFARMLKVFNQDLTNNTKVLQGQFQRLSETKQDHRPQKFAQEFERLIHMLHQFVQSSEQQIPLLQRKAEQLDAYQSVSLDTSSRKTSGSLCERQPASFIQMVPTISLTGREAEMLVKQIVESNGLDLLDRDGQIRHITFSSVVVGQYDSQHGIDLVALSPEYDAPFIIEVKKRRRRHGYFNRNPLKNPTRGLSPRLVNNRLFEANPKVPLHHSQMSMGWTYSAWMKFLETDAAKQLAHTATERQRLFFDAGYMRADWKRHKRKLWSQLLGQRTFVNVGKRQTTEQQKQLLSASRGKAQFITSISEVPEDVYRRVTRQDGSGSSNSDLC